MTGFSRRPLAVFVCCMFAGIPVSHCATDAAQLPLAQGEVGDSADKNLSTAALPLAASDSPLRLRSERKFNLLGKKKAPLVPDLLTPSPVASKKDDSYPLFVVANSIEGRIEEITEAQGDVCLLYTSRCV